MSSTGRIPFVITQAITGLVMHKIEGASAFSRRAITTLKAILSYVDAKDAVIPIFPKREKLALRCQYDARTVQRALNELITAGWIRRLPQERKRRAGRVTNDFSIVPLALTDVACYALGLPFAYQISASTAADKRTAPSPQQEPGQPQSSTPSMGLETLENKLLITSSGTTKNTLAIRLNQPTADQGSTHSVSSKQKDCASASPRKVRIGQYTIPADLLCLITVGLLPLKHVFFLMRQFSQQGVRLQDVIQLLELRLSTLKGKELFAYLHALTRKDIDWKLKLSSVEKAKSRVEMDKAACTEMKWGLANLNGRVFEHHSNEGVTHIRFFVLGVVLWFEETLPNGKSGVCVAKIQHVRAVKKGTLTELLMEAHAA